MSIIMFGDDNKVSFFLLDTLLSFSWEVFAIYINMQI